MVLALGVAALVQLLRSWRGGEAGVVTRLHRGFIRALDLQFALGLVLYGISPLVRSGWSAPGEMLGTGVLRFFTVEHAFGMVVAVAVAHIGFDRLNRTARETPGVPLRRGTVVTQMAWLVITLVSIPWSPLEYGRPLLRPFF